MANDIKDTEPPPSLKKYTSDKEFARHQKRLNGTQSTNDRQRTISVMSHESLVSVIVKTGKIETTEMRQGNDDVILSAPDGGWGWVIVAAGFFSCVFLGFLFASFTVLYVALVEHFDSGRGETGWIGSLYAFTGNFLGKLCIYKQMYIYNYVSPDDKNGLNQSVILFILTNELFY